MAFADIDYFGDNDYFGGKPQWSGRITDVSQLDNYEWGRGRKQLFSSTMSGKSNSDMDNLIEEALKRKEKSKELKEKLTGVSSLLREFNKKDNADNGVSVGMESPSNCIANDKSFTVDGATTHSQFMSVSRITYNSHTGMLCQMLRPQKISGMGRVVGIGGEQVQDIARLNAPSMFFSLENKDGRMYITNCMAYLGCLGAPISCDDVEIGENCTGIYYAVVNFEDVDARPELKVELMKDDPKDVYKKLCLCIALYEFENGVCKRGNPGVIIIPTFTAYGV